MIVLCALLPAQTAPKKTPAKHKSTASAKSHSAKTASSKKTSSSKKKHGKTTAKSWRRGQQKIDPTRAREIQEALIREHYMDGNASGVWDQTSQSAMEKFQADNGWQTKVVPDSRALIKLGLGPDQAHLLNPESAMTTMPSVTSHSKSSAGPNPPQK